MARKRTKVSQAEHHRPSDDLPIAPRKASSPETPQEENRSSLLNQDMALDFPTIQIFEQQRTRTAIAAANNKLLELQRLIAEELYINPQNAGFTYEFEAEPQDVCYIVAASLQKAGFAVSYDGGRSIHINLPSVRSLAGKATDHISAVTAL